MRRTEVCRSRYPPARGCYCFRCNAASEHIEEFDLGTLRPESLRQAQHDFAMRAMIQRDYNLLLGVFVVCSAMVLIFNLVTDLVYRMVDPRIDFAP